MVDKHEEATPASVEPGAAAPATPATSTPAKRRTRASKPRLPKAVSAALVAPPSPAYSNTGAAAGATPPPSRRLSDRHLLDSDALEDIDRMTNIALGQMSGGISPASLAMAYLDWMVHLGSSPGKQFQLAA
ncbi:poly-beta-hydroxybutyrate polymerase N-terminal domain-containing protein, partial [Accumulibacter sp.]|uniref:poly-beta-hydroxybutyrate polymerase N-terminal domain-containing protein n=1 Tax=Accumulibacter sp. TaxID=2053492 RepID=UPI0028C49864